MIIINIHKCGEGPFSYVVTWFEMGKQDSMSETIKGFFKQGKKWLQQSIEAPLLTYATFSIFKMII